MTGSASVEIGGTVEPGFEAVREAFATNFAEHGEVGAAVAVYKDGRKVVDLWGGVKEKGGTTPYGEDALQLVFSSTKGATAACANLLAQRGQLDLDARWPSTGPSSPPRGRARSRCGGCSATRPACPTWTTRSACARCWPGTRWSTPWPPRRRCGSRARRRGGRRR